MAKVRVYELAKEFGVESKAVMAKLNEMGEFVRSASSTIEAPVVRKLTEAFSNNSSSSAKPAERSGAGAWAKASPGRINRARKRGFIGSKMEGRCLRRPNARGRRKRRPYTKKPGASVSYRQIKLGWRCRAGFASFAA